MPKTGRGAASDLVRAWRQARRNAKSASPVPPITMRMTPIERGVVPSGPSACAVPVVPNSSDGGEDGEDVQHPTVLSSIGADREVDHVPRR